MCKFMRIKCLKLFFLVLHTNADMNPSNDSFNQDPEGGIRNLENGEPGLSFTDEEMAKFKIWRNGIVPYYIDTVSFDPEYTKKLDTYLESTARHIVVKFLKLSVPPKDQSLRWVFFVNRRGLQSSDDFTTKHLTNEGVQKVVLGYDSPHNGGLYETTLAILGVPPQHNAPNRDDFITVNLDNVLPEKKYLFEKLKDDEWLFHDLGYDYYSAGHYGFHKYTNNGQATIEPKLNSEMEGIGDGKGFSFTDIWKIRMLYNYITKTQTNTVQESSCKKMFKPGPKFNISKLYLPDIAFSDRSRPKPKKYFGKVDDEIDKKENNDDRLRSRTISLRPVKRITKSTTKNKKY